MKSLKELFDNNRLWIESSCKKDPNYFSKNVAVQKPKYLWIGCSDSRVPANEIVSLEPGELFVHRNVGNLFSHTDLNALAVLEYAVDILQIKHIIVCGHYGCGAIQASLQPQRKRAIDHWLRSIRDIYSRHSNELNSLNTEERANLLAELNVKQQVLNICHNSIIQNAWAKKQSLWIHGWIYDLKTGKLKDLNLCFSKINQVQNIYHV